MIIGLNNSKPSLSAFKKEIEKEVGKIEKSKKLSSDNIYNWYSLLIGRYHYSFRVPIQAQNSNSRKNYRAGVVSKIGLLNKKQREKF